MPVAAGAIIGFLFGPIFWGVAFLAPLMAQLMVSFEIVAPFGLTEIQFTLIVGLVWGVYAKLRGSWI